MFEEQCSGWRRETEWKSGVVFEREGSILGAIRHLSNGGMY